MYRSFNNPPLMSICPSLLYSINLSLLCYVAHFYLEHIFQYSLCLPSSALHSFICFFVVCSTLRKIFYLFSSSPLTKNHLLFKLFQYMTCSILSLTLFMKELSLSNLHIMMYTSNVSQIIFPHLFLSSTYLTLALSAFYFHEDEEERRGEERGGERRKREGKRGEERKT